jgi:DNA-binding MarR family transcriptional regulator
MAGPRARKPARKATPRASVDPRAELTAQVLMGGRKLSTAAVMYHAALAEKQGLGATETKALDLVDRFGPLTAGELGERAGLAPASVTGLVDRLERKGMARRIKDPSDGRRVLIELERARLMELAPLFDDLVREMQELAGEFSVEQLRVIVRFLEEAARRQQAATARL